MLDKENVAELLQSAKTAEEIIKVVNELIDDGIDKNEATQLATNKEVLASVTQEQAAEIFNSVVVSELTEEQANLLIEAVQDAPLEVREEFQNQINIFEGTFDEYVPVDSKISVGERRVVVAVSAVLSVSSTIPSVNVSSSSQQTTSDNRRRSR